MANTRNIRTNAKVFGTLETTSHLTVNGNATVTGNAAVTGNTTITGNLVVTGTVSFGAGSVFSDATFDIHDDGDTTKELRFQLAGATTTTTTTMVVSQTANRAVTLPDADTTLVGHDTTQTLTNKSIDADTNTITNIENADIKVGADIARSKLASGSNDHVVINNAAGVMVSEAYLSAARGGLAADASAFTGVVKALAGVFTAASIVNADIDAAASISRSKLDVGTADHVIINSGAGAFSSEAQLAASRGGLATDASAFSGVVKATAGVFSAASIVNADIDAAAAIARSKTASGTAYVILANNASGVMSENAALTAGHVVYADANGQLVGQASLSETRGGTAQTTYTTGDTLYASASNTLSKLAIGSPGQILKTSNSSIPTWEDRNSPTNEYNLYDDFMGGTTTVPGDPWQTWSGGSGALVTSVSTNITSNHPGILRGTTGTTATGRCGFGLAPSATTVTNGIVIGTNTYTEEWLINLQQLSTVAEEFVLSLGLKRNATADTQANGVLFKYDRATYGTNWQCETVSASTTTRTDSAVAVVDSSTWMKLRIEANTTNCKFYIDGVLVATHTTNIPTTNVCSGWKINKTVGNTPVTGEVDYFRAYTRFSSAR